MSQFNGSSYSQSLHTLSHRLPRGRCSLPELGIHQAVSCRWGSSSLLHAPLCSPASALLQQEGSSSPVPVRCSYIPYPGIQGASQCGSTPLDTTSLFWLLCSPHPSLNTLRPSPALLSPSSKAHPKKSSFIYLAHAAISSVSGTKHLLSTQCRVAPPLLYISVCIYV